MVGISSIPSIALQIGHAIIAPVFWVIGNSKKAIKWITKNVSAPKEAQKADQIKEESLSSNREVSRKSLKRKKIQRRLKSAIKKKVSAGARKVFPSEIDKSFNEIESDLKKMKAKLDKQEKNWDNFSSLKTKGEPGSVAHEANLAWLKSFIKELAAFDESDFNPIREKLTSTEKELDRKKEEALETRYDELFSRLEDLEERCGEIRIEATEKQSAMKKERKEAKRF